MSIFVTTTFTVEGYRIREYRGRKVRQRLGHDCQQLGRPDRGRQSAQSGGQREQHGRRDRDDGVRNVKPLAVGPIYLYRGADGNVPHPGPDLDLATGGHNVAIDGVALRELDFVARGVTRVRIERV